MKRVPQVNIALPISMGLVLGFLIYVNIDQDKTILNQKHTIMVQEEWIKVLAEIPCEDLTKPEEQKAPENPNFEKNNRTLLAHKSKSSHIR